MAELYPYPRFSLAERDRRWKAVRAMMREQNLDVIVCPNNTGHSTDFQSNSRYLTHVGGGHAVIYGPDGAPLADKLPEAAEGLLIAEIDLGAIGVAKNAMDPVGHYSRPDVHRLLLNKTPSRRVEHFALPIDAVEVLSPEPQAT